MLRVTLARPERRNAFDAALIDELTGGVRRRRRRTGGRAAQATGRRSPRAPTSSGCARRSSSRSTRTSPTRCGCARCSTRSTAARRRWSRACRACARRRLRARRVLRHRGRGARRAVRVQRGEARDRPGGHLAVRAREDRAGAARRYFVTGERFDAETALRIGLVHEIARDLDAAVDRESSASSLAAGPEAARAAKQSRPRATLGRRRPHA